MNTTTHIIGKYKIPKCNLNCTIRVKYFGLHYQSNMVNSTLMHSLRFYLQKKLITRYLIPPTDHINTSHGPYFYNISKHGGGKKVWKSQIIEVRYELLHNLCSNLGAMEAQLDLCRNVGQEIMLKYRKIVQGRTKPINPQVTQSTSETVHICILSIQRIQNCQQRLPLV